MELARKAGKVIAVDISVEMLEKVKRKATRAGVGNIEFLQSDGTNVRLEAGTIDLILLVTVFHEIDNNTTVLKEFSRILKAPGKLVIAEIIKKGFIPMAQVQNPQTIQAEVTATNFYISAKSCLTRTMAYSTLQKTLNIPPQTIQP